MSPAARPFAHLTGMGVGDVPDMGEGDLAPPAASAPRSSKKAQDPDKPKRPASAWLRFLADYRAKHPEIDYKKMMTVASAEWKQMSDESKSPYVAEYQRAKAEYDLEFKAYSDSKQTQDPAKPKKPQTAWMLFLKAYRETHAGMKSDEIMKTASAEWKQMSDESKSSYVAQSELAKAEYERKLKEYTDSGKAEAWERDHPKDSKKTKTPETPSTATPETPSMAFLAFESELRETLPGFVDMEFADQRKIAAAKWEAMSEEELRKYETVRESDEDDAN